MVSHTSTKVSSTHYPVVPQNCSNSIIWSKKFFSLFWSHFIILFRKRFIARIGNCIYNINYITAIFWDKPGLSTTSEKKENVNKSLPHFWGVLFFPKNLGWHCSISLNKWIHMSFFSAILILYLSLLSSSLMSTLSLSETATVPLHYFCPANCFQQSNTTRCFHSSSWLHLPVAIQNMTVIDFLSRLLIKSCVKYNWEKHLTWGANFLAKRCIFSN